MEKQVLIGIVALVVLATLASAPTLTPTPIEEDYKYEITEGDFNKTKVEIFEIKTPTIITIETDVIARQRHRKFSTPVVSLESDVEFKTAKITLPITGLVDIIFKCSNFDQTKFECVGEWEDTNIPFAHDYFEIDDGNGTGDTMLVDAGTISFDVNSFSAYGGGIIEVTAADHLDSKRVFISDIYDEVKKRDNIWSEPIPAKDYVRVTFEEAIGKTSAITVYARSSDGDIKIYRKDGVSVIAQIINITSEGWYFANLDGLGDTEKVADFDLKVVGNSIEFDYIADPTLDDFEDETLDRWTVATNGGGTAVNSADAAKFGSRGVRFTSGGDSDTQYYRLSNTEESTTTGNYYTWIRTSDVSEAGCAFMLMGTPTAYFLGHMQIWNGTIETYSGAVYNAFSHTPQDNTWYRFRIYHNGTTNKTDYYLYDADNVFIESILNVTPTDGATIGQTRMAIWDIHSSPVITDFDNTSFTDTIEPVTDSCTCPASGHWEIINGDKCTLSTPCTLSGGDLHISDGSLTIVSGGHLFIPTGQKAIISNDQNLVIQGGNLSIFK